MWIEICIDFFYDGREIVTPRAGVWIEIKIECQIVEWNLVTPRAGVWIEIHKGNI